MGSALGAQLQSGGTRNQVGCSDKTAPAERTASKVIGQAGLVTVFNVDQFDPTQSVLAGLPPATLNLWLVQAQTAYFQLMTGDKVSTASYAQGDGSKSVQYTQADAARLLAFIQLLQQQLGVVCRPRRPITFRF